MRPTTKGTAIGATEAPRLLNIEDVANRLSISPSLVRRYIRDGKLESVKLGDRRLIEERAIAALIADVAAGR